MFEHDSFSSSQRSTVTFCAKRGMRPRIRSANSAFTRSSSACHQPQSIVISERAQAIGCIPSIAISRSPRFRPAVRSAPV